MTGAKRIVRALAAIKETTHAAGLAQLAEALAAAAGEQLVDVALMRDVEHELVVGRIEDAMEANRELDDPEIGADMTSIFGGDRDEFLPDFLGQSRQLRLGKRLHV